MATAITGNTYAVRNQLKALGGRWSPSRQCWMVPDDKAEEAKRLVEAAGPAKRRCGTFRRRTCQTCGSSINYGVYCGKCEFGR